MCATCRTISTCSYSNGLKPNADPCAEVVVLLQQALIQPRSYDAATYATLFQQIVREREDLEKARGPFPDSVADIRADRERDD
jgi:hypothetical protein